MVMASTEPESRRRETIPVGRPFTGKANAQLESQRGQNYPAERALNYMQKVIWRCFSIVPWTLSRAWYTGTVPSALGT